MPSSRPPRRTTTSTRTDAGRKPGAEPRTKPGAKLRTKPGAKLRTKPGAKLRTKLASAKSTPSRARSPRRSDAATAAVITAHMSRAYRSIHDVVVRIPRGKVMTYGDVAAAAGMPRAARVVGYAMRSLGDYVPWQRVIGRRSARIGQVTIKDPVGGGVQRQILEKEGIRFSRSAGIDLDAYGWGPPRRSSRQR